ncbi:NAD-dependent epimerase/dehydratase family protein [Halostella pelagica]|uniref:NAD-dependent epimerase/dehydratase family protein n=1 Tax=Halostella pelagica TaxID=2583824 RepID=UPI001080FD4A
MRILVMGGAGFIGGHLTQRFAADGHDAEHTHANSSKTSELLGYDPRRTIQEGVAEFVKWYHSNRKWYEPLVLES